MICNPVGTTARKAAERELRVVKAAMQRPDSLTLWVELEAHRIWLHHLIGGPRGLLQVYVTERFQALTARGLVPDAEYLADPQRRIEQLIFDGEATYAP